MWFSAQQVTQIDAEATREELGPLGAVQAVRNRQGLQLWRYLWPAEDAVGVVFAVHGFGSHAGNFLLKRKRPGGPLQYAESIVEKLNRRGYSVACMDLQGCGRSDGCLDRRGFFYEFADLVSDLVDLVNDVQKGIQGFDAALPSFLFGASLGGCLAVHVAHRCPRRFDGVALLAPMLSVDQLRNSGMNRIYSAIGSVLNLLIPDVPLLKVGKNDKFPEIQEFWERDPAMFKGRMRVRVGWQCLKAIEWVQQHTSGFSFPFIIIHGTEDTLCDPKGSQNFFKECKSIDKTLHMAENMWHLLTAEPGHEKVLETVLQWFDKRVTVNEI